LSFDNRDAQLSSTSATKDRFCVEFSFWPNAWLMIRSFLMARKARVEFIATVKFDGDDIQIRVQMLTVIGNGFERHTVGRMLTAVHSMCAV
jgi:hypothetical protein